MSIMISNEEFSVECASNSQNKVDARATGKYIAIKFQNTTATTFELNGYDIEYEVIGER